MCILTPIDAYTGHNLEWGIDANARYNFSAKIYETHDIEIDGVIDEIVDDEFYYYYSLIEENTELNDVKDNVTSYFDVWGFDAGYYQNGTRSMRLPFYLLPIGNWSLLTVFLPQIIEGWFGGDSSESVFIDNETVWGFRYEQIGSELGVHGKIVHLEMLKEDGVLWYLYKQYIFPHSTVNLTEEFVRLELGDLSLGSILIVGGTIVGLSLVIAVLIIVIERRQRELR